MERVPWHPRLRHAGLARRLVIAAVAALTLAVVAAVGMAATSATPNGCPTDKSTKPAPIAQFTPPARLQIEAFNVLSGPVNEGTQTFTLKVRVGSTCSKDRDQGRERLRDRGAVQPVHDPGRGADRERRQRDAGLPPRRELPRERPAAAADALHPRDKAGRGPPRRHLVTTARRGPLRGLTAPLARPRRNPAARPWQGKPRTCPEAFRPRRAAGVAPN